MNESAASPYSHDAEQGVLSCFLQNPADLLADARSKLPPDAFYHPGHRVLYEEMLGFSINPARTLDLVTISQHLSDRQCMDKVGGPGYLAELLNFIAVPSQYPEYKGILIDKLLLRRIIAACQSGISRAHEYSEDITQQLSLTESEVFDVLHSAQTRGDFAQGPQPSQVYIPEWIESTEQAYRNRGKITGIRTGLNEIDLTLHGIDDSQGEVCIFAGRPGMGKTALAATVVDNLASSGVPGAVFSLEMSRKQLLDRIVVGGIGLDTSLCITGMFSRDDYQRIGVRAMEWQNYPVHINEGAVLTTADLRAQVQVLKRKHGIRWIVIDHLHLMKGVGKAAQDDERLRLVEVMETLQFIKKQFKIAIFLMVQLNRESDRKKAGEPPVLADLSGSAAIEQFADHVIFIHRPSYYKPWHLLNDEAKTVWIDGHNEQRERNPSLWSDGTRYEHGAMDGTTEKAASPGYARQDYEEHALLYVRKNRRGPTPELSVRYTAHTTRFSSRQAKVFSNNAADRQVGYQNKPAAARNNLDATFE
jgi:replicative DNA helicase